VTAITKGTRVLR
jgi:hypothetical protein